MTNTETRAQVQQRWDAVIARAQRVQGAKARRQAVRKAVQAMNAELARRWPQGC